MGCAGMVRALDTWGQEKPGRGRTADLMSEIGRKLRVSGKVLILTIQPAADGPFAL